MNEALPFDPPVSVPRPSRFAMPGADGTPHALAELAARELIAHLDRTADPELHAPGGGKMFGVLVAVTPGDELVVLRGFSGMLGKRWVVPGFVPPLFDPVALASFWPAGEAEVDAMTDEIDRLRREGSADAALIRELESRRRTHSRGLFLRIVQTYRITNAKGELRPLTELFAPGVPPGGAGDCAAPKLVGAAHRHGLRPLALAELWWGAPMGTRTHGSFQAPCELKCGPVLAHMLAGL